MKLETYLKEKYAPATAKQYQRSIAAYLGTVGRGRAETASYGDIVAYLGRLRGQCRSPGAIKGRLYAIKAYYGWLVRQGTRESHPCRGLRLKDRRGAIQLQDLFAPGELEQLLGKQGHTKETGARDRAIISLLVYQALTKEELTALETRDINLETGTVRIKGGRRSNGRVLPLRARQIMLLHAYTNQTRPKWLKNETGQLFITSLGTPETGRCLKRMFQPFQGLFPGRPLNPKTIRQSVIANLLKEGKGLLLVQAFAGHKYPSSTEKYRQTGIEELQAGVEKYHPLNK